MKLVIEKSKWLRGLGGGDSGLLIEEKMCCLGFLAKQCGVDEREMGKSGSPACLSAQEADRMPAWLLTTGRNGGYEDSEVCEKLMDINDDENRTDRERKEELTAIFKEHDIEVEFVD